MSSSFHQPSGVVKNDNGKQNTAGVSTINGNSNSTKKEEQQQQK
jgi:hypothetical protein